MKKILLTEDSLFLSKDDSLLNEGISDFFQKIKDFLNGVDRERINEDRRLIDITLLKQDLIIDEFRKKLATWNMRDLELWAKQKYGCSVVGSKFKDQSWEDGNTVFFANNLRKGDPVGETFKLIDNRLVYIRYDVKSKRAIVVSLILEPINARPHDTLYWMHVLTEKDTKKIYKIRR
jgi:hypothetical protein